MCNQTIHKNLAKLKQFTLRIEKFHILKDQLSSEELAALNDKGYWLEGLASGKLLAFTDKQRHFVSVCAKRKLPLSIYETAWIKYSNHIDYLIKDKNESSELERIKSKRKEQRIIEKEKVEKIKEAASTKTPDKIERSLRIIKNAILNGKETYERAKQTELKKGYISDKEIEQVFEEWKDHTPESEVFKQNIKSKIERFKTTNPLAKIEKPSHRNNNVEYYHPFVTYSTTDGQ